MTNAPIQQTLDAYFAAMCRMDTPAILALFTERGVCEDPYGTPPKAGQAALGEFFTGLMSLFTRVNICADQTYIAGNRAAIHWSAEATGKNGKEACVQGIDVFFFDPAGKIERLEAYWNPGPLLATVTS